MHQSPELISYCCNWLQKWTVIIACHRWCIKLRHVVLYGQHIVGSERWQRQPQQQSHLPFQHLGSSRIWTPHVGEKATMVREPGNEQDWFIFLMLHHSLCCLNFYSCVTSHKYLFFERSIIREPMVAMQSTIAKLWLCRCINHVFL